MMIVVVLIVILLSVVAPLTQVVLGDESPGRIGRIRIKLDPEFFGGRHVSRNGSATKVAQNGALGAVLRPMS
jgi:hypothetical protein